MASRADRFHLSRGECQPRAFGVAWGWPIYFPLFWNIEPRLFQPIEQKSGVGHAVRAHEREPRFESS
jgi:hypothetical protein